MVILQNISLPWEIFDVSELIKNISKIEVSFPTDITVSTTSKRFITECLKEKEINRLSWDKIFNHEIIVNKYKFKEKGRYCNNKIK